MAMAQTNTHITIQGTMENKNRPSPTFPRTPLKSAMALGKSAVEERSVMPKNWTMSDTMSPAMSMLSVLMTTCTA